MKILLAGTHFTVAQATVEELKKFPKVEIVYVGREKTLEGDPSLSRESLELPKLGVKFIPITSGRLRRNLVDVYTITSILKIPIGFIQAFFIIFKEKPDVLLSFGGYVSVPLVFWAWLFSIPVIIHEQTLISGLANKISSLFADKIAVSFKSDYGFDKQKVILTGNPMREEITRGVQNRHTGKMPTILITGGNQGSHVINIAVEDCLDKLTQVANVIHQTGDSKFKDFERLKVRQDENYTVTKWIPDMGNVLGRVDLVVGRAGINTLSELAYLGIPALVTPVPYLYKDEQNKNAKYFEKLGLVKILSQSQLSGTTLFNEVKVMLRDLRSLRENAKKAKEVIIPNAAKRLVLETILLAKR